MSIVKLNNQGVKNATAIGSITGLGSMIFIKKLTASGASTLTFHDGSSDVVLDNTYKEYIFTFNNIHTGTDSGKFQFQGNAAGGADFNETMVSTYFHAQHNQAGSYTRLDYRTPHDNVGTGFTMFTEGGTAENERSVSGYLHLFNPSSTTFVKHFIAVTNNAQSDDYCTTVHIAGYFNTTSAIDEIRFQESTGTFDGDICLYGIA
tara:strand:- start:7 stop:621 length:615 start_codon:yes stop_codon:yes gene_type:complete